MEHCRSNLDIVRAYLAQYTDTLGLTRPLTPEQRDQLAVCFREALDIIESPQDFHPGADDT